jgi:glycosyltransferase involved in cell wall biosynthesis
VTRTLHWICDAPSPYNAYLFRTLAAVPGLRLQVHYRRLGVSSHPWTHSLLEGYQSRAITSGPVFDSVLMRAAFDRDGAVLMVGGWYDLTLQALITFARAPFAIWTDTPDQAATRSAAKETLRAAWLRGVLPRAARIFGTGTPALEVLAGMGAPRSRLASFPYWIDLDAYCPATSRTPGQPVTFVSSGRLVQQKGYDYALRALAAAFAGTDVPFRYRVAGTGPEEAALRGLATSLGIADAVEWLGWTEPAALPALYREADAFLHPARWEPYGVVILEAMASGLPVLASRRTNAALDRIVEPKNGRLHDVGDIPTLASQLRWCHDAPDARVSAGLAAHQTAHEWPISRAVHMITSFMATFE